MKNNNSYFKMPKLQSDGKLLSSDGLAIYQYYLSQERLDYKKNMTRPCRSSVLKAMKEQHLKENTDASSFVNKHLQEGGKILFWSDQHFYHHNIIEYSNRPFDSIEHMNNAMISNYFKNVNENDLVIFGGDIAFGELDKAQVLLQNLPGKKLLVLGNHDFDKKMIYRNYNIFDMVTMAFVFHWDFDGDIANILVTHYPISNQWLPPNTINVHGHIHQYNADIKNINMSVEKMEYSPQRLGKQIKELFLEIKQ